MLNQWEIEDSISQEVFELECWNLVCVNIDMHRSFNVDETFLR